MFYNDINKQPIGEKVRSNNYKFSRAKTDC